MMKLEHIIINGNNIELRINEGRSQIKNYWIAKVTMETPKRYSIDDFLKAKEFDEAGEDYKYIKLFKGIADGDYVINSDKKGKDRMFMSVVEGKIEVRNK